MKYPNSGLGAFLDISALVIISFIFMSCLFDHVLILLAEIRY